VASFYLCSRISDVFEKLVGVAGRLDNAEVLVLLIVELVGSGLRY
jgi:hypothetical protein